MRKSNTAFSGSYIWSHEKNKAGIVETIPVDFYNKNERLQQALSDGLRLFANADCVCVIICAGIGLQQKIAQFLQNSNVCPSDEPLPAVHIKEGSVETNPALFFRQSHEKTI